jgi:hypothetical protein
MTLEALMLTRTLRSVGLALTALALWAQAK